MFTFLVFFLALHQLFVRKRIDFFSFFGTTAVQFFFFWFGFWFVCFLHKTVKSEDKKVNHNGFVYSTRLTYPFDIG